MNEVPLQQVVDRGRLYLDADKLRVERRRDDFARAQGRGADEYDLAAEGVVTNDSVQHVHRGHVRERTPLSEEPEQQVALSVERYREIPDRKRRGVDRGHAQRRLGRVSGRGIHGKRKAWIHPAVELGDEWCAPEDSVGVWRGIQKPRARSRFREHRKVADGACRVKVGLGVRGVRRPHHGKWNGTQRARTGHRPGRIKRQPIAENGPALAQHGRERLVGSTALLLTRRSIG